MRIKRISEEFWMGFNQKSFFKTLGILQKTLAAFVFVAVSVVTLQAQNIWTNNINDNAYSWNPYTRGQSVNANLTVSGIGRGSGISGTSAGGSYNTKSYGSSFNTSDYIYFKLTPKAGYKIDFVNFNFQTRKSGTGPKRFVLRSSVDGFTSNIYNYYTTSTSSRTHTVSLSASQFQSIQGQIEFRIYAYEATSSGGTFRINYFNFRGYVNAAAPTLNNPTAANITSNSATLGATLVTDGGQTVTERGIVWSTSANPEEGAGGVTKVAATGTSTGAFTANASSLPEGTKIYYRGYTTTNTDTYYSTDGTFFTLSQEPAAYPNTFTATTQSKNSIKLDWTQVGDADGYLILQRIYNAPTGTPSDASEYAVNNGIGNGTVVAVIPSGSTTTTTITGLLQGTRYHYTLFPYGYNGTDEETFNYRTQTVIPAATDSTWGKPTSLASTIENGNGEALKVSTIINDDIDSVIKGTQVWTMNLTDGGPSMNDDDDLPTIATQIIVRKGTFNTVSNWSTSIQSAALFDDSTGQLLANGAIGSSAILFTGFTATAADDNYRPLSIRITLKKRAHIDNQKFHFSVKDGDVITEGLLTSSQKSAFTSLSDTAKNKVDVVASKLQFVNHPPSKIEAGMPMTNSIEIEALDTFGGKDVDYNGVVTLNASANNLIAAPRSVNAVNGIAEFDTVRFNKSNPTDTLIASATNLYDGRSNKFEVENSKKSDIIVKGSFTFPNNIHHLNYNDKGAISTSNSLEVFKMVLRDGGAFDDADFESTVLSALDINVQSSYLIHKAALYSGATKLVEVDTIINNQLKFNSFNLVAADNDSAELSLRVTFKDSAIDSHRLVFGIDAATTTVASSIFAKSNAGGASSSTQGKDNVIDVVAKKLAFLVQPTDVTRGTVMKPFVTVMGVDSLGNIDLSNRNITLSVTGSAYTSTATNSNITATNGEAEYNKLIFGTVAPKVFLTAKSTSLDSVVSDTFEVRIPYWYRSVKTGLWSDTSVWETSDDYGTNWLAATEAPNFDKHGQITISAGDTVHMDGTNALENTIDETIVEKGAVLVTTMAVNQKLIVNDAAGTDLLIEGKLLHNNGASLGGLTFIGNANARVKAGAEIELTAFGDAINWAGNAGIHFDSAARYVHSTSIAGTITNGTMFPNATANEIPVFVVNESATYPDKLVGPLAPLTINGLLDVTGGKTFTLKGKSRVEIRDGITGAGKLMLQEQVTASIFGAKATISGSGDIDLKDKSHFEIGKTSYTTLLNNKLVSSTANSGFVVAGTFDAGTVAIQGPTNVSSEKDATIITANPSGLFATFSIIGTKTFHPATSYRFNGSVPQIAGDITSNKAKNVWVDNAAGVRIVYDLTVTDTLYLGSGNLSTSKTSVLSIAQNAGIKNYSASSFINGPLNMWVAANGTAVFPVGYNTNYGEVTYTSTTNASDWITIEYVNKNASTDGFNTLKLSGSLKEIKANDYWTINSANATAGRVKFDYTSSSATTGIQPQDLRVATWDGNQWVNDGPISRNATSSSIESDELSNFSVFTIAIDSTCTVPSAPAFSAANICLGDVVSLAASGTGTIRWFVNTTDATPFATGNNITIGVLGSDSTFYVEAKDRSCFSNRVPYTVTINAIPQNPVVSGDKNICYNQASSLSTASTSAWYSSPMATTPVFSGTNFTTANLINDTTFYVKSVVKGCESSATPVTVKVKAQVQKPIAQTTEVCFGSNAEVSATSGLTLRWFNSNTSNTVLYTGSTYTLANVQNTTSVYVEAVDGNNCPSEREKVDITINALPTAPVATNAEICEGNSVQLTTTSAASKVYWYANETSSLKLDSGLNYNTSVLFADKSYYASSFDGKCHSNKTRFDVTVYEVPVAGSITTPTVIAAAQTASIQSTVTAQNYEWNFGADATPQTATGAGPHNVSWSTHGVKTITLKVWNGSTATPCSTEITKAVYVGGGVGFEEVSKEDAVKVYPNPVNNSNLLFVELPEGEEATVIIIGALGKQIATATAIDKAEIATTNWSAGVYLVIVKGKNFNKTVKVVK